MKVKGYCLAPELRKAAEKFLKQISDSDETKYPSEWYYSFSSHLSEYGEKEEAIERSTRRRHNNK